MKISLIAIITLLSSVLNIMRAQQHDIILGPTRLLCTYSEKMMIDTISGRTTDDYLTLRIGDSVSSFYSHALFFADSLKSSHNGFSKWMQIVGQYSREGRKDELSTNMAEYIFINYPEGKISSFAQIASSSYAKVVEDMEMPEWTVLDSARQILGYDCRQAVTDFRGRKWTAWFTPEIPVSAGPWKLWGLPGLIIEAKDLRSHYHYILKSVTQPSNDSIALNTFGRNYRNVSRIEYLRAKEAYAKDPNRPTLTKPGSVQYDYRETDYHKR